MQFLPQNYSAIPNRKLKVIVGPESKVGICVDVRVYPQGSIPNSV